MSAAATETVNRVRPIASGRGWSLADFTCASGPGDPQFEEQHGGAVIALVQRGSFTYSSDRGRALLHPGAVLLGNAGACYSCGHDHGTGDLCRSLKLAPDLFAEISATEAGAARFSWPVPMLPASREFCPPGELETGTTGRDTSSLDIAVLGFVARLVRVLSGAPPARLKSEPRDERRIARVLRHMELHATLPMDLDALAAIAGMSKFHFIRVFRGVTGRTPYGYLIDLRLEFSSRALSASRAPVTEIALDVGFDDLSTFNAAFKRRFGMPPSAFRRRFGQT